MKKAGFSAYDRLVAVNAAGATVALNPNANAAVVVADAATAIRTLVGFGASEAALGASAAALGVSAGLLAAYVAAIKYSPGQVDATMDDCMSCGRMIQNHVNMMNQKADELAAKVNAEAKANSQSTPADPNSAKPDPEDNKPAASSSSKPPGYDKGGVKQRGSQGYKDPDGNIWKKDQKHKDHWDVSDGKGKKIKEVDFNGRQIWPGGPKNKNKTP